MHQGLQISAGGRREAFASLSALVHRGFNSLQNASGVPLCAGLFEVAHTFLKVDIQRVAAMASLRVPEGGAAPAVLGADLGLISIRDLVGEARG
jgi:hypothetical protein